MIFNDEYDASLWCMIKADKKNRKELVDFLKEIPEELIINVRTAINKAQEEQFEDETFSERYISKDNPSIYYSYDVDFMNLTITKSIDDGKTEQDLFRLTLNPISLEDKFNWLGTISNVVNSEYISENMQVTDEIEREYTIHHLPVGYFVSYAVYSDKRESKHYRPISLKKIPNDLNRQNIL